MSFLMTKVGLNVLFSINQSVSHHNIMLLLPYVSQLSDVTNQLKDISLILMKCGQSSVFRVAYNDGRLKIILSVPGGENSICSSMGCSIDNLKKLDYLTALLRADFQDVKFQLCTKTSCRLQRCHY
jgi:hypothetical protein